MNATAAKLQFRRVEAGTYQAQSETLRYMVIRAGRGWKLTVWRLLETAGVKHCIALPGEDLFEAGTETDTKTLAVDIARRYEQLIAEGYGQLFTGLRPMTRAVIDVYEAEAARFEENQS